jgi:hypothetical protein
MRLITFVFALAIVTPALAQTAPDAAPVPAPPKVQDRAQDQAPAATRENLALPPPPRGRFSFAQVDEGFLRFDHKSGDVALCKPQSGSWNCDAVPGSSVAQQQDQADQKEQKEIADLRDQVLALQKEVASLRPPPPPPHPVPPQTVPPAPDDQTGSITLKQDIARARGYLADAWRRLVDMIDNLQKDMRRRGNDDGTSRT